jgi:hypothetical protein
MRIKMATVITIFVALTLPGVRLSEVSPAVDPIKR